MKVDSAISKADVPSWPVGELAGFEHRFCTIEGLRLHYVAGGREGGACFLLLAGFPESWFAWRNVMPRLGETRYAVALDRPGQGDSDRPADGYDTGTVGRRVKAFLDRLGIDRCVVVGHDIGAWLAFSLASAFPEAVTRLVLLDAGIPGVTLPDALPVNADKAWHLAFHMVADLPETMIGGRERAYLDWFLRRKSASPQAFTDADIEEYLRVFTRDRGLRAGLAFYRSVEASAAQNRQFVATAKLPMPVLAIGADQGSISDMATPLLAFAELVTGRIMPHCGHFIPEEQPEALADEIVAFLD